MPAIRTPAPAPTSPYFATEKPAAKATLTFKLAGLVAPTPALVPSSIAKDEKPAPYYPTTPLERASFRRPNDKPVTEFQWRVYDYTCRIPKGRVCTYGEVCKALGGGSPRSVGGALRANPFAPTVPCHRVIASTLFIGGFFGKWGIDAAQVSGEEEGGLWKMRVLAEEGVAFDKNGFLADRALVWRGEGDAGEEI